MTIEWRRATPQGRPWNGSFQLRRIGLGNSTLRSCVLRPILSANLLHRGTEFSTFALVDSGADWSVLPWEVAEALEIDVSKLLGPDHGVAGSTGMGKGRIVEVTLSLQVDPLPGEMTLPFLALYPPKDAAAAGSASKSVLIGRHPFFEWFDIHFRMGFTTDPDLGKWTIREVTKRHAAERFRKAPAVPALGPPDSPSEDLRFRTIDRSPEPNR